jgi:hypothetical protein
MSQIFSTDSENYILASEVGGRRHQIPLSLIFPTLCFVQRVLIKMQP